MNYHRFFLIIFPHFQSFKKGGKLEYIYVQSHGHSPGASLTAIRNSFLKEGCKHAVFFDESDSVLVYDSTGFVIEQAEDKDETCVVGLGLKYTPKPAEKK